MKTLAFVICLLVCGPAEAYANFASNPHLPYPPSCVQDMGTHPGSALSQHGIKFHESQVELFDTLSGGWFPMTLAAYRTPCTEPNRSLVWIEFTLPGYLAGTEFLLELPFFVAEPKPNWRFLTRLVSGPDGWGAVDQSRQERVHLASTPNDLPDYIAPDNGERRWVYLLGLASPGAYTDTTMTASEYNAEFKLLLRYPPYDHMSIDVPATADLLSGMAVPLPLSGRHSGAWIVAGAENQGIQISIIEQVGERTDFVPGIPNLPLLAFFTHYTFDAELQPIWLVGSAEFEPGASAVTFDVLRLRSGQFRGYLGDMYDRVGRVTLTSRSCDDVLFAYDYGKLGLGAGSARLQRAFSLETAGYDCRDYEARIAANR